MKTVVKLCIGQGQIKNFAGNYADMNSRIKESQESEKWRKRMKKRNCERYLISPIKEIVTLEDGTEILTEDFSESALAEGLLNALKHITGTNSTKRLKSINLRVHQIIGQDVILEGYYRNKRYIIRKYR